MSAEHDLKVEIEDSQLVIRIGISTLATAVTASPYFERLCFDPDTGDFDEDRIEITDEEAFAKEILHELCREREDGATPVHLLLDEAAERAFENGAEGVEIHDATSE